MAVTRLLHRASIVGSLGSAVNRLTSSRKMRQHFSRIESARQEWEEGSRRLEALAHDRARHARLLEQLEVLTDELRRRVGQTFTVAELVQAYDAAERWSRDVVAERAPGPGWPATLSVVENAAFHRFQRGAVDYEP